MSFVSFIYVVLGSMITVAGLSKQDEYYSKTFCERKKNVCWLVGFCLFLFCF